MSLILALLLGPPDPELSDMDRLGFPDHNTACRQECLYRAHVEHLRNRRWAHGYQDGRWDAWLAEAQRHLAYWELLAAARGPSNWWDDNETVKRRYLARLKETVGERMYYAGWTPPLLDEPPAVPGDEGGANHP